MATVRFYNELGGVLAVFPYTKERNGYRTDLKRCYSHIGQHSACAPDYLKERCTVAKKKDWQPLAAELTAMGYELKILNKE